MATTDYLTLFCLVEGRSTSEAFTIKADPTKTLIYLKHLIKSKQSATFSDITADQLTLWKVFIPDDSHDATDPITIDILQNKTRLDPTEELSNVFPEEPDKNTFILQNGLFVIIETVHYDDVKKELGNILNSVRRSHVPLSIDPKDAETFQRQRLVFFFKKTLPFFQTAMDTKLVMLGLGFDKEARSRENMTLRSIVEDDIGALYHNRVVTMVAPSGSGKTATLIDVASQHFVIYCACCHLWAINATDFKDQNFNHLGTDVEEIYRTFSSSAPTRIRRDPVDFDKALSRLVSDRVSLEFLARVLFLQLLLDINPDLEPLQFFREQTTTGQSTISTLVHILREYDLYAIEAMLIEVERNLRSFLDPRRRNWVIALDRAHIARDNILHKKFISQSSLAAFNPHYIRRSVLFDDNNEIRDNHRIGFLTPLSAAVGRMQATFVILGTAPSLLEMDGEHLRPGKESNVIRIVDFPQLNEDDVSTMLSSLIDLSGCHIPFAKRHKLSGRAVFSIEVLQNLVDYNNPCTSKDSKQAILDDAVDRTINHFMMEFKRRVRSILEDAKTDEPARLFCRMVLAQQLHAGKVTFPRHPNHDFVKDGFCRLQYYYSDYHLIMDEPMVLEAVQEGLGDIYENPKFQAFDRLLATVNVNSARETALERLVRQSLQRFNGYRLIDLPFLRGCVLPNWCSDMRLQLDFFPDKRYAGALVTKLNGVPLCELMHEKIEASTDIWRFFPKKKRIDTDNLTNSPSPLANTHTSNIQGILRIYIEFPSVLFHRPPPICVQRDPTTGQEDVMVCINLSNMDDFFDELVEGRGDAEDMTTFEEDDRVCLLRN
ncbi:hypothetical protein EC991_009603 [Linnemannia zychae]|nr:hypothetical protein EC991_009603 [Linnemannia zychae]